MKKNLSIILVVSVFALQAEGNEGGFAVYDPNRSWAGFLQQGAAAAGKNVPGLGNIAQDIKMAVEQARQVIQMGQRAAELAAEIQKLMQQANQGLQHVQALGKKFGVPL